MHTWICDEEILFCSIGSKLLNEKSPLYGAFDEFRKHQRAVNARNLAYIEHIYSLEGISGTIGPSRHVHAADYAPTMLSHPSSDLEAHHVLEELSEEGDLQDDDGTAGEVSAIIDYLAGLSM